MKVGKAGVNMGRWEGRCENGKAGVKVGKAGEAGVKVGRQVWKGRLTPCYI